MRRVAEMNIKKTLIIISCLFSAIIISLIALTHTTSFRTYMIRRDFGIDLPEKSQLVSYERKIGGESSVSFTIPTSDLKDFITYINNVGYTELLDAGQISLTYYIIDKWNLDENNVYGYYENFKSKRIGNIYISLSVALDLIIMNSNEGFVTVYMHVNI